MKHLLMTVVTLGLLSPTPAQADPAKQLAEISKLPACAQGPKLFALYGTLDNKKGAPHKAAVKAQIQKAKTECASCCAAVKKLQSELAELQKLYNSVPAKKKAGVKVQINTKEKQLASHKKLCPSC